MPHSIALKGPWQVTGVVADGIPMPPSRLVIREPQDWERWFSVLGNPKHLKSVQFGRAFNWPSADRPDITLAIRGARPTRILLNQVDLLVPESVDEIRIRIETAIQSSNQLAIEFDLSQSGDPIQPLPLLSDAMLWIDSEV